MLSLNDDLTKIIYVIFRSPRKILSKSFQQYYQLYLPQISLDWNMKYIENSMIKDIFNNLWI